MMQDWNDYRDSLGQNIGAFGQLNGEVLRGVRTIGGAAAKTRLLEPKVHELIALAVAVTTRCDGCIASHTKSAIEQGASLEEISEALGVAVALNAGAALVHSAKVIEAHAQLTKLPVAVAE